MILDLLQSCMLNNNANKTHFIIKQSFELGDTEKLRNRLEIKRVPSQIKCDFSREYEPD